MQCVFAAAAAELHQFETAGVITTILLSRVIAFLALSAGQRDHGSDIFLLRCHF